MEACSRSEGEEEEEKKMRRVEERRERRRSRRSSRCLMKGEGNQVREEKEDGPERRYEAAVLRRCHRPRREKPAPGRRWPVRVPIFKVVWTEEQNVGVL